tara:strand:- start:591 stop:980 length:390 start_codon:yes stop_codon:yes gene_type:complete
MTWEDILKISTEDAISDARRYAKDDINEASQKKILDVWLKMGLEKSSVISDNYGEFALSPKGKEPEGMYNKHFYFLMIRPAGYGYFAEMAKVGNAGKFDKHIVKNTSDAKAIGERYLERHEKAVETYQR